MAASVLRFTQEQVRTIAGATEGDLRHWRRVVPYLSGKRGKAARFTFSEVVGVSALAELTRSYGVRVAQIAGGANQLFKLLATTMPAQLDRVTVVLTPDSARFGDPRTVAAAPALLVPCGPIADRVRTAVIAGMGPEDIHQRSLPFPPKALRGGRRSP